MKRALLVLQIAAVWPVWPWYARRLADPSDHAEVGLIALVCGLFFLARTSAKENPSKAVLLPAVVANVAYACLYPHLLPLFRAALAFTAIGTTSSALWRNRLLPLGVWGLLLLALPVTSSLQFVLGYPMRVVSGAIAAFLLRLGGWPVTREGAMLRVAGESVWIDAPCSGVRMLWAAAVLGAIALQIAGSGWKSKMLVVIGLLPCVLLGNAVRALVLAQLTVLEVDTLFAHELVGAIAFLGSGAMVLRGALMTERRTACALHS